MILLSGVMANVEKHSLAFLLRFLTFLNITSHMMLINVVMPANTEFFFSFIFDLISIDLIDTDPLYELVFNYGQPLNAKFSSLGYSARNLAPNLGFLFLYVFLL